MKSKKLIYITSILLIAMVIAAVIIWYYLPINRIYRAFDKGDYEEIVQLYEKVWSQSKRDNVKERLIAVADEYYDEYLSEEITYSKVMDFYDLVTENVLKRDKYIKTQIDDINEINVSRDNYEKAAKYMRNDEYILAIQYFEMVSEKDQVYKNKAEENIDICKQNYCSDTIMTVASLVIEEQYEAAKEILLEALAIFPDESLLIDKLAEIEELINKQNSIDITGVYKVKYDVGELIANEMGISGYKVECPVTVVLSIDNSSLSVYVDEDSIHSAIEELTKSSMDAIYAVASDYGIGKKEADIAVLMMYKGSYADFIMDNFGDEISDALNEFSYEMAYIVEGNNIIMDDDGILEYSLTDNYLKLVEYNGDNTALNMLDYPVNMERE